MKSFYKYEPYPYVVFESVDEPDGEFGLWGCDMM